MKREISFTDFITGEKKKYLLSNKQPFKETLTDLICPLDDTALVISDYNPEDGLSPHFIRLYCPNCQEMYSSSATEEDIKKVTQKDVINAAREYLIEHKKKLSDLEQEEYLLKLKIALSYRIPIIM
jgi:hypothetical protein